MVWRDVAQHDKGEESIAGKTDPNQQRTTRSLEPTLFPSLPPSLPPSLSLSIRMQQQPPPPPPLPPLPPLPPQQLEPPRAPPIGAIPYIGSRISLISKTDIRYEGYLFNIDTRQSMVALQSVRSFGTEGRRAEHIPPSPQVLQYATFKASEIKDLHVSEAAPPPPSQPSYGYAQPPPLPPGPPQPPVQPQPLAPRAPPSPPKPKPLQPTPTPTLLTPGSVSSAHQQQLQAAQATQLPVLTPEEEYKQNEQRADAILAQQSNYNESRRQQQNSNSNNNSSGGLRTIPGMGGHLLKRKERRVPGGEQHEQTAAVATAQDFDFEERLTAFNKEEEFSKLSTEQPKVRWLFCVGVAVT